MNTAEMNMLTNADQLIDALKACGLVNIAWGGSQNMLCGNPLHYLPMLDISCSNEDQAWMINRAKEAISRGDEAAARKHVAPLIRERAYH
jgi:hypothetical protein